MKEFRDDKRRLEIEIGKKLREFCVKYGVRIEDIEVENFDYAVSTIQIEIKVDL